MYHVQTVSDLLQCTVETTQWLISRGLLRAVISAGEWWVPADAFLEYLTRARPSTPKGEGTIVP